MLSQRSILELRVAKLIIAMLVCLLVFFLVVVVSVALESVHSSPGRALSSGTFRHGLNDVCT
jgi:hypothetical protein